MKNSLLYSLGLSRQTFSSNFTPILFILIIAVITVTPILFNEIYATVLWIVFFLLELNIIATSNRKLGTLLTLGIIFISMCAIYAFVGISSASIAYCIHSPLMYFAPVLALMVIDRCDNEQQIRFLFHFLALAIAINIADNIWLTYKIGINNIVYQKLFRIVEEEEGLTGLNLGAAGFVNMAVFYSSMTFMAFLKSNKKIEKCFFLVYFGISAYFIVFCSLKASAVLLLVLSLALMFISYRTKDKVGIMLTFTAIAGGLFFLYRDSIINFLIDIIASDRITVRLMSLTTEGDVEDSTLMGRSNLWCVSLQSWLSSVGSFLFGIGDHNWRHFSSVADSGIGNHSDLFDVFGRYGITGALLLYSSIKIYYDYLQKRFGSFFKFEIISFFILILLMGFTKKFIMAQTAIVIFILFPLALRYLYNQKTI